MEKLHRITKNIVDGVEVTAAERHSWRERYCADLRSRTQGRATYTMQFDAYQQVPEGIASEIIKRVRGE